MAKNTVLPFAGQAMRILAAPILAASLLLSACAGGPVEVEVGPDPARAALEEAGRLVELAAPEHLRQALEILFAEASTFPESRELSALAGALFGLLYPELAGSGFLGAAGTFPPYRGPHRETLERAMSGQPPRGGSVPAGDTLLDLVMPALFLWRVTALPQEGPGASLTGTLRILEEAEATSPGSVLPPYLRGRAAELQGEAETAAGFYRESVDRAASFYPGRRRLGELLLSRGDAEGAAAVLGEALGLVPADPSIRISLARAYRQGGSLEEAAAVVAQGLIRAPEDPDLMLERARILAAEGNWNQALRPLNLLLYQHPDNRQAYLLMAEILYDEAKKAEEALEILSEAQAQFPTAADLPELAGRILLETGRQAEGLNQLQRALDLEPGRVSSLRLLLADSVRMKRWLQAAIFLSQILEQEHSPADLLRAAEIYNSLGDSAQVLHYAEQLYQIQPTEENLILLARAFLNAGKAEQAGALVDAGLERAQSPGLRSSLYTLKARMVEGSSPEQALGFLREALLEHPDNLEAITMIAELYRAQAQLRKAVLYLKRAVELDSNNAALAVELRRLEKALDAAGPAADAGANP